MRKELQYNLYVIKVVGVYVVIYQRGDEQHIKLIQLLGFNDSFTGRKCHIKGCARSRGLKTITE